MKIKFSVQTKDSVKSKETGNTIYFEVGKEYEIEDNYRINKIISNGWGKVVNEPIKKVEEIKEEEVKEVEVNGKPIRARKPKVE